MIMAIASWSNLVTACFISTVLALFNKVKRNELWMDPTVMPVCYVPAFKRLRKPKQDSCKQKRAAVVTATLRNIAMPLFTWKKTNSWLQGQLHRQQAVALT